MGKDWTRLNAGTIKAAEQRVWFALGSEAGTVAERICSDLVYANDLAYRATQLASVPRTNETPKSDLLEHVNVVRFSRQGVFYADETFIEGVTVNGVSFAKIGGNFKKFFLQKIEKDIRADAMELNIYKLLKSARDVGEDGIIPALGGRSVGRYEITLCGFLQLLCHKQRGKDFVPVVGYIPDGSDELFWTVCAKWNYGIGFSGWNIEAHPPMSEKKWGAGTQIVSL
jgi:hypothetical protein